MRTIIRVTSMAAIVLLGSTAIACGTIGAWDAHHGVSLCEARHDWFDEECRLYTFDYANWYMARMWICFIATFPFVVATTITQ